MHVKRGAYSQEPVQAATNSLPALVMEDPGTEDGRWNPTRRSPVQARRWAAAYECVFDEHFEKMSGEEKVAAVIMNVVHNFVILKKQTAVQLPLLCPAVPHPLRQAYLNGIQRCFIRHMCVGVCVLTTRLHTG